MPRRKGKNNSKQDDSLLLVEPSVGPSRGIHEYVVPVSLFFIVAVGGSTVGWFCSQQQQTIDDLSETLTSMQTRITKLQQELGTGNAQLANVGGFGERLVALEEAYAQAQRQAEVALAASEQINSKDLQSKVWALQTELNSNLAELQKTTISIASLNAIIKNKSAELETMKQSIGNILSANSELTFSISGLTNTLSDTKSRLDEQVSVVDALISQLQSQKKEISVIKKTFLKNQEALGANAQELISVKAMLESEQIKRAQYVDEQLKSLQKSLEYHQTTTRRFHSHLTAQLEVVQTQFLSEAQEPSRMEDQVQFEKEADPADDEEKKSEEESEHDKQDFSEERVVREEKDISGDIRKRKEKEVTVDLNKREEEDITEDFSIRGKENITKDLSKNEEKELTEEFSMREEKEITQEHKKREREVGENEIEREITHELEVREGENTVEQVGRDEEAGIGEEASFVIEKAEESEQCLEEAEKMQISVENEEDVLGEENKLDVAEEIQVSSEKTEMKMDTSETEKQIDENQTHPEASSLVTTEETAVEDQTKVTEKSVSEKIDIVRNKNQESFVEKQIDNVEEEHKTPSKEMYVGNTEMKETNTEYHQTDDAEKEIHTPSDETDIATDETSEKQLEGIVQEQNEHEAAKELPEESTKN